MAEKVKYAGDQSLRALRDWANQNFSSINADLGIKSVTANGTYTASDDGYDGYSQITVAVNYNDYDDYDQEAF